MKDSKKVLKEIIERLHRGEDPESLKRDFSEVLDATSAEEISKAEEELIREGLPREKVRKLCDVHLAVFRESLETQTSEEETGHPIHTLKQEHQILLDSADELTRLAQSIAETPDAVSEGRFARMRHLVGHFRDSDKHYLREENVLFPYLEKHGIKEPPAIMWMEHDSIRAIEKEIYALVDESDSSITENSVGIAENAQRLRETLSSHFYKENNILFPTALNVITDDEWQVIMEEFDEVGYCCFTPGRRGVVREKTPGELSPTVSSGIVNFETGTLPVSTLEAILNTLPIDITFVDADDKVRYFSGSEERIFVRSRAVLGREVQLCHPQKSVHMVNQTLEEFREGSRDSAVFWIEIAGRIIYIRYLALRDVNGEYLGCLEVTQDITDIRKIQGQKRLLD